MRISSFLFVPLSLSLCMTHTVIAQGFDKPTEVDFNEHIRPILSEYCFGCHGPDSESRQADLRLDRREEALASGVIVPGKADDSELITRITSTDPDVMMPPPDAQKTLNPEHRRLLGLWIAAGAKWEKHWAFVPPRKPRLPAPAGAERWARNPVDCFILEKARELELEPNAEAERHTLARRAALDLTGLPPARELVESFVGDTRQGAYGRYVDTLLASPHAGEHRARYWLDAARYGDTHGMHVDNYREIWPYRDWVVRAFNANMPFDQFVIEQIAGDLLPDPTLEQRIATGFNRCHVTTAEGGSISEEVNVRYMVDRVETTATVFLGLTAGCAVCHNHKYDPLTQREFYQLGAFFNNTTQPAMDGNQKDTPPVVTLPAAEFKEEWIRLEARRKELRDELSQWKSGSKTWWPKRESSIEHPVATDELLLWLPLIEGEGQSVELPESASWATGHPAGRRGIRFGDGDGFSVDLPRLRTDEPLTISFWFRTPDRVTPTKLFEQSSKIKSESSEEEKTVGWLIECNPRGGLSIDIHDGSGQKIRGLNPAEEALRPRSWQHICVRYSGGQSNSSISILVDGRAGTLRKAKELYIEATELAAAQLHIGSEVPTAGLSDIRIFRRWVSDEEVQLLARDVAIRKLLSSDAAWSDLEPQIRDRGASFYDNVLDERYRARSRELSAYEQRRDYIYSRSTTTLVMQERRSPPRAWVLERGAYDQRREEVSPDVPSVLPPLSEGAPRNRLGFAQWLVRPDHPLTARVMVNRLWQSLFGVGLVKTSEDFGIMGERPSNPALLDWLAAEFVESKWNVNELLKLIVTSATYRQSSTVTAKKLEKDPDNRFLTRGPRIRLDAEVLRDQALAVSGLLRREFAGPSVRPYQPAGLWKVVSLDGFDGSNTNEFKQDSGDALYRRSLYTFWKRTSPPPSMAAFNAPTREQCTVRRERTNTPLQALVLMNDPQFVEAARHLGENALAAHDNDSARASWMLSAVLSRPPSKDDQADMLAAANGFREIFMEEPQAANQLIKTGQSLPDTELDPVELAVWTMLANTLMNRDDFINKN